MPSWYSLYDCRRWRHTQLVFMQPQGPHVTAEQARALDDDFFTSQPLKLFTARVASLLDDAPSPGDSELAAGFATALGRGEIRDILAVDGADRDLCRALDALALRHHAAETLVRFAHAVLVAEPGGNSTDAACTWAKISSEMRNNVQIVAQLNSYLDSERGLTTFWRTVIPVHERTTHMPVDTPARVQLMGDWLVHAMNLLIRDDIDISAGYNKFKHGLAIRSRNDMRVTFVNQELGDGGVPLSAVTGPDAVDLIDTISVDFLSQPRKIDGRKPGLEYTTLRLDPAVLLAEAWMIAMTHGAMFHVAAARHFDKRPEAILPVYPDIPGRPAPDQLLTGVAVGMRGPVTAQADGGPTLRGAGFAIHDMFISVDLDHSAGRTTVIVDG